MARENTALDFALKMEIRNEALLIFKKDLFQISTTITHVGAQCKIVLLQLSEHFRLQ